MYISVHQMASVRLLSISARAHEPRAGPAGQTRPICCVHAVQQQHRDCRFAVGEWEIILVSFKVQRKTWGLATLTDASDGQGSAVA